MNVKDIFNSKLPISIIPDSWYIHIQKEESIGGKIKNKPHLKAIVILSHVLSLAKGSSELQIAYLEMINFFEFSDKDTREAVVFLENLGLIKRDFRTLIIFGTRRSNCMFLIIDYSKIQEITHFVGKSF